VDVGVVLAAAAIAIPNLLRARIAANEASAVGKLRAVNTAEVTYASSYRRGFAADLATLGPDPTNPNGNSPAHANLLNDTVAEAHCRGMQWCESSGYRFIVTGACNAGRCRDFVATATPVSSSTGTRNFCSTGDGVIRYQIAPPLTIAPTARDCKQWPPIE
jgi:type II secretory pathway pseudopilin PulG